MGNCPHVICRSKLISVGILTFLIYHSLSVGAFNITVRDFITEDSCNLLSRVNEGCAELTQTSFQSLLSCAFLCKLGCFGFAWISDRDCYIFKTCSSSITCNGDNFTFYRRINPCQHNGVWNVATDTCQCVDCWVGARCERLPTHCKELREYGYPLGPMTWYICNVNISTYFEPIRMRCILHKTEDDWFLMVNKGELENNKTWSEYVNGYEDTPSNFWVGLEKIKALNEYGLKRFVIHVVFNDQNYKYTHLYNFYGGFQLSGASSGYSFTFSEFWSSQSALLCLGSLKGARFSTWDNDMDEDSTRNCASEAGVGWWFKDCNMSCNLLGQSYELVSESDLKSPLKIFDLDLANTTEVRNIYLIMMFKSRMSDP